MRLLRKVWIGIIVVCIGLSVYEIPKARFIWRYVRSISRTEDIFKDDKDAETILTEEIIASDPEAADILRYCITDPNVEELAVLSERYPQNEFFLAQFAEKLIDANLVDSRAVLTLTNRLIELNPNNSHHRYLKGWAILNRPGGSEREKDALDQFKLANGLSDFTLPYEKYKERTAKLLDKLGIDPLMRRRNTRPSETGFYWDMGVFMSRSLGAYPKLDEESFRSISAELSKAASRLIENARTYGNLDSVCMLFHAVETIRLRELDLSESELQLVRFRLSQAIEINEVLSQCYLEMFAVLADLVKLAIIGTISGLFLLTLQFPLLWLIVIIVNWIRGRSQHVSVGIKAYILFFIGLCGMFGLLVLLTVLNKWLAGRFVASLASIGTAIFVWILLWLLTHIHPVDHSRFRRARRWALVICGLIWAVVTIIFIVDCIRNSTPSNVSEWLRFLGALLIWFVLCTIIWAIAVYRQHVFRVIPYSKLIGNRFVRLILVLLLMTGITILLEPIPLAPFFSAFLTILFVGLIATHVSEARFICLEGIRNFFGKDGEIVNTRTKMVRIMSTILVLCWVTILVAVHISAGKWSRLDKLIMDPLSLYRPLPQATQHTYEKVLSRKHSTDPRAPVRPAHKEDGGLPEKLYLASPEDLSAIINERQVAGNPIRENLLLKIMASGGHDVRPIVLNALKDPDALDVLMMRAKWRDRSVKEQLEQIFEEKTAKLAEIVFPILKDPNSIESLIIRANWGDETVNKKLEQLLEAKITELSERVHKEDDDNELRSELTTLLEMDSALTELRYQIQMLGWVETGQPSPFSDDPNGLRKARDRTSRIRQLITDAKMPELLKGTRRTKTDNELLTTLTKIAGALAFVSNPQEAEARFSKLIELVGGKWQDDSPPESLHSASLLLKAWVGTANDSRVCLFYRYLGGVPKPYVTNLLKDFLQQRQVAHPYDDYEFLDLFSRAGNRELAEWVFNIVNESPPTTDSYVFLDDIPIGQPMHISEYPKRKKQIKDHSHQFLEAIYPHLNEESVPLLLEHLDSGNEQLRAFVVWRLTSLGYEWTSEQIGTLLKDDHWKVRLNALFACDTDDLETALEDESGTVRVVAQILSQVR